MNIRSWTGSIEKISGREKCRLWKTLTENGDVQTEHSVGMYNSHAILFSLEDQGMFHISLHSSKRSSIQYDKAFQVPVDCQHELNSFELIRFIFAAQWGSGENASLLHRWREYTRWLFSAIREESYVRGIRYEFRVSSATRLLCRHAGSRRETLIGSNSASIRGASSYRSLAIDPVGEIEFSGGFEKEEKKRIDQIRWAGRKGKNGRWSRGGQDEREHSDYVPWEPRENTGKGRLVETMVERVRDPENHRSTNWDEKRETSSLSFSRGIYRITSGSTNKREK